MPDDCPVLSEAVKALVKYRQPATMLVPSLDYEDVGSWIMNFGCTLNYDARTTERILDLLRTAEAESIAGALVHTFKDPSMISAITRKLAELTPRSDADDHDFIASSSALTPATAHATSS